MRRIVGRNPRDLPICGDILRKGGTFAAVYFEVLNSDRCFAASDVPYFSDGVEHHVSLTQWQNAMRDAEVIRKGKV